jgi:hypothetical protein
MGTKPPTGGIRFWRRCQGPCSVLNRLTFIPSAINSALRDNQRAHVSDICRVPRAIAEEKLAEADRDKRHRKRLITAAEGWLVLAGQLRRLEKFLGYDAVAEQAASRGDLVIQ